MSSVPSLDSTWKPRGSSLSSEGVVRVQGKAVQGSGGADEKQELFTSTGVNRAQVLVVFLKC